MGFTFIYTDAYQSKVKYVCEENIIAHNSDSNKCIKLRWSGTPYTIINSALCALSGHIVVMVFADTAFTIKKYGWNGSSWVYDSQRTFNTANNGFYAPYGTDANAQWDNGALYVIDWNPIRNNTLANVELCEGISIFTDKTEYMTYKPT